MRINENIKIKLEKSNFIKKLLSDFQFRTSMFLLISLIINLLYAAYNGFLGITTNSVWFKSSSVYYFILIVMRFSFVLTMKSKGKIKEASAIKFVGFMLFVMSVVLAVINYLSLSQNIILKYGTVTMITIATYTFSKLAIAIAKAVKYKNSNNVLMIITKNIRLAEVAVSMLTMQRSMLVSFGEGSSSVSLTLNAFTGILAFAFVLILGIRMCLKKVEKQ